jgi:hypothetical protein
MFTATAVEREPSRGTTLPASSAVGSLLLGFGVYLFGRDWGSVLFLEPFAAWQPAWSGAALPAAAWLPSLFHAYGFALLIILMLRPHPRAPVYGAFGWFVIAACMEWLQSAPAESLVLATHRLLTTAPVPVLIEAYVVHGRFDAGDILATALGCLAACVAALRVEVPR